MDSSLLAATIGLLAALAGACVLPVYADSTDDLGNGMSSVIIPRYVPTPRFRPRTWAFLGIAAIGGLVFVGWQRPSNFCGLLSPHWWAADRSTCRAAPLQTNTETDSHARPRAT